MQKMKKFVQEFKDFINKGNVIDMAVAVIIGAAFSPIIGALVNNIIMPLIGLAVGKMDFTQLKTVLVEAKPEVLNEAGEVVTAAVEEVAIGWGVLIAAVLNFIIVALCVFLLLKGILAAKSKAESLKKKEEEEAAPAEEAPAEPVETDVDVLKEIRDILKAKEDK